MPRRRPTSTPLPSRAVLWIGLLSLCCLVLSAALVLQRIQAADQRPAPAPPTVIQTVPVAAPDAQDPTLAQLVGVLDAVQRSYAPGADAVPKAFTPGIRALAEHLNAGGQRYAVRLFDPDARLAARRADALRSLFAQSGLAPDRLTLTGHPGGTASVEVAPLGAGR